MYATRRLAVAAVLAVAMAATAHAEIKVEREVEFLEPGRKEKLDVYLPSLAFTTGQAALEPTSPYPGVSSSVRCVIDMYGITNILTRRKPEPSGRPTAERHLGGALEVYGAADANAPVLRLGSPVTHVTPASPPVLILHGRADATVDYLQAEELAAVLERHRVPHELILLDNVGHTFAFRTWGKKKLARDLGPTVLDFLAKHMR